MMSSQSVPQVVIWISNITLAAFYSNLIVNNVHFLQKQWKYSVLFLLIINTLIFFSALTRKMPQKIGYGWMDAIFAFVGSFSTLFLLPTSDEEYLFFEIIQCFGMMVSMYGIYSLRRSFGILPANRGLVTFGAYRYLRHPIYAGYILSNSCFIIQNFSLWNLAFFSLFLMGEIGRIYREETLLAEDASFQAFKARTRWRLIPYLW